VSIDRAIEMSEGWQILRGSLTAQKTERQGIDAVDSINDLFDLLLPARSTPLSSTFFRRGRRATLALVERARCTVFG